MEKNKKEQMTEQQLKQGTSMKSSIHLLYGIIIGILISLISGCGGAYAEKKKQERERTGKRSKLEWFIDKLVLPSAEFYDLEKVPDTHFEQ